MQSNKKAYLHAIRQNDIIPQIRYKPGHDLTKNQFVGDIFLDIIGSFWPKSLQGISGLDRDTMIHQYQYLLCVFFVFCEEVISGVRSACIADLDARF